MTLLARHTLFAGLAAPTAVRPERAFAAWPERNVTLIHGLAPGGGVDVSCRVIAGGLSRRVWLGSARAVRRWLDTHSWAQPRPGASATLPAGQIARAAPDGYTLGYIPGSHAV